MIHFVQGTNLINLGNIQNDIDIKNIKISILFKSPYYIDDKINGSWNNTTYGFSELNFVVRIGAEQSFRC